MEGVEALATVAIGCGLTSHRRIGSGLLESAYEAILATALERRDLSVERQETIGIRIDDLRIDAGLLSAFQDISDRKRTGLGLVAAIEGAMQDLAETRKDNRIPSTDAPTRLVHVHLGPR